MPLDYAGMKLPRALLVSLAVLPALGFFVRSGAQEAQPAPRKPVAVFLLRHAETAAPTGAGADPKLSEQGEERAQDLARLLGKAGVTHLYASEYARAQATLAPLAGALGLAVETVPAAERERQVDLLRGLPPGSVAVVAGHSNTVPALARGLGGELRELVEQPGQAPAFEHGSYDRLVLLTLPGDGGAPQTIELRYGD